MKDAIWDRISEQAKELIKDMLCKDYKNRKYAKDILTNPWFSNAPKKII